MIMCLSKAALDRWQVRLQQRHGDVADLLRNPAANMRELAGRIARELSGGWASKSFENNVFAVLQANLKELRAKTYLPPRLAPCASRTFPLLWLAPFVHFRLCDSCQEVISPELQIEIEALDAQEEKEREQEEELSSSSCELKRACQHTERSWKHEVHRRSGRGLALRAHA